VTAPYRAPDLAARLLREAVERGWAPRCALATALGVGEVALERHIAGELPLSAEQRFALATRLERAVPSRTRRVVRSVREQARDELTVRGRRPVPPAAAAHK
jgi:hypothetical protein